MTGAAGFIGSTLSERLVAEGATVVGVDNLSDYYSTATKRDNLAQIDSDRFSFVHADLNEIDLEPLVAEADVVFHIAGQPGVRGSWGEGFSEYVSANISATQRLLEATSRTDSRPKFVYASSSSIYGDAEAYPTHELTLPRPRSPYGVTKLAGEQLCRLYAATSGLSTVSLRFFTVYGPRQRPDMAFTRFLTAALTGTQIDVYGTGEQVRDFTYVDDIVDAVSRAATVDVAPGSVYNVSGGGSHSVNEVLDIIEELTGRELNVRRQGSAAGDVARTSAETTAIRRDFSWAPRTDLRAGLQSQLEWVRGVLARA
ncbi:NAD-dependent epimerase/dehydratase family protein [Microbacterium sp. P06]|uniref:NAD-dependent epimerase/dehydratase family protein n=1 Tax=Microbacterium sp. P06 TaxID=3366949 RepID=UPI00374777BB